MKTDIGENLGMAAVEKIITLNGDFESDTNIYNSFAEKFSTHLNISISLSGDQAPSVKIPALIESYEFKVKNKEEIIIYNKSDKGDSLEFRQFLFETNNDFKKNILLTDLTKVFNRFTENEKNYRLVVQNYIIESEVSQLNSWHCNFLNESSQLEIDKSFIKELENLKRKCAQFSTGSYYGFNMHNFDISILVGFLGFLIKSLHIFKMPIYQSIIFSKNQIKDEISKSALDKKYLENCLFFLNNVCFAVEKYFVFFALNEVQLTDKKSYFFQKKSAKQITLSNLGIDNNTLLTLAKIMLHESNHPHLEKVLKTAG